MQTNEDPCIATEEQENVGESALLPVTVQKASVYLFEARI